MASKKTIHSHLSVKATPEDQWLDPSDVLGQVYTEKVQVIISVSVSLST